MGRLRRKKEQKNVVRQDLKKNGYHYNDASVRVYQKICWIGGVGVDVRLIPDSCLLCGGKSAYSVVVCAYQ